jgi:DNA polymerase
VFVTNAVLCNPRWENGNNRPPDPEELTNCSFHLERQIALVGPYVIATLGRAALEALSLIEPHAINMSHAVATPVPWNGRVVFPLYHPSPRAMVTRPYADQLGDFRKLKEYADAIA